jgi:ribonuclease-3
MNFVRKILSSRSDEDGNFFVELEDIIGFRTKKKKFYKKAFTHRSMNQKDVTGIPVNYERLEFLGDAMLSAVISGYLFNKVPSGNEGYLTKMRSKIVSREHLNELGRDLKLIDFVKSRIPKDNFGENIHGNLFEALVGAIFLDRGYKYCEKFIDYRVISRLEGKVISYKSLLIEWCQKEKKSFKFDVYDDTGNDELKHFAVKLFIDDRVAGKARATSKKKAEEKASKRAYFAFQKQISL